MIFWDFRKVESFYFSKMQLALRCTPPLYKKSFEDGYNKCALKRAAMQIGSNMRMLCTMRLLCYSALDGLRSTQCVRSRSMQCFDAFMFVVAQCGAWFISSFGKTCQWRKRAKPNSSASSVDEMRQHNSKASNGAR